jgi:hypothetical protein
MMPFLHQLKARALKDKNMDQRDHLILALSALLRSERETRHSFEACIAAGILDSETLQALVADPVPVITREDLNFAENLAINMQNLARAI